MELNFKWKRAPTQKRGIHCGAEKSQEWMLPWWWSRYCDHNDFPVTFFDFGMTEEMKLWCAERGEVIAIEFDASQVTSKSGIDPTLIPVWEGGYGNNLWNLRVSWMKKVLTFLHSRYERAIWIDLDCEILGPLSELFSQCEGSSGIALVRERDTEHLPKFDPGCIYNSGVLAFKHGSKIIEQWAEAVVFLNHQFSTDDLALTHFINTHRLDVIELPPIYNWRMAMGLNLDAVIVHWIRKSKNYIREHGGIKPVIDSFQQFCRNHHG